MSMHEKPGLSPGSARANGLRRRIVFELEPGQLPMLEEAERRHGSKRAALLAALAAEAQVQESGARAEEPKAQASKQDKKAERKLAEQAKEIAKLKRDLASEKKTLAERESELAKAQKQGEASSGRWSEERAELQEALEERDEEVAELSELAVNQLYCGRCGEWAAPEDWAWQLVKGKGSYAYHRSCGDHGPGLMSSPSWLARRLP